MPTVAHCATPYLHTDGSWLYNQLNYLQRYRPVVLTQEARNLDEFPVETLHCAEAYPPMRSLANRLWRKWSGEYPFYSGIMRREGAQLVHAHFGDQACRCLRAVRRSGLPLVTSFYGYDATQTPRQPYWAKRYLELFEVGRVFLVEGSAMRQRLIEAGCPAAKIRLQRLGIAVERIAFRRRTPNDQVRFLICAAFREKKGITDALCALGTALRREPFACRVTLIGDGPLRPQIEAAIRDEGLADKVEMLGMQPYSRVIEHLQRHDILLQTSRHAADGDSEGGAPVILLDAQAAGMPVVATDHADIPEYVRDGISGLLAPEGQVERIAAQIASMVRQAPRWGDMGQAGRRHVEENYNAATQAILLEALYDELVAETPVRAAAD
jgi:colanic acid/amylovoran biosynthesis glycosyltransferase